MEQQELSRILEQGEGLRIEFKEAQNGVPETLYDTVVSFLNREGGVILLGVDDDSRVLGLDEKNLMQLKQDIVTALNNPEVVNPPFPLAVNEAKSGNSIILYIRVPISSFVHRHGSVIYDRENDSDFRVTDEARIAELYARKRNVFTENQIFSGLKIDDLDPELFQKVKARIALLNANHPWLTTSNERILRDARFLRRDFTTGDEGLTLASALVFGTNEVIGNILPAYRIDILERRVDMNRWDDRLLLKTNLIDSYLETLKFIKSKWPEKFYQENGERKDLRELIFRELVANLIIHREYNNARATEIIIYDDRIEAINPNRARFSGPLDLNTFEAEPKNPNIRAFFNVLGWADEIGSGVKNMNKYISAYSGGAHPVFIEGEPFKSILPLQVLNVGDKFELFLNLSQLTASQLSIKHLKALKELPLDLSLKNISDLDELAIHLTKYWGEKSAQFHKVRFLINEGLSVDSLKKVTSWQQKSVQLLKKRGWIILSILLLTLQPVSPDELAIKLGYLSKRRFRDDYLKPLKDNGLIAYTMERANDPNQAYLITEKGKSFLGRNLI